MEPERVWHSAEYACPLPVRVRKYQRIKGVNVPKADFSGRRRNLGTDLAAQGSSHCEFPAAPCG